MTLRRRAAIVALLAVIGTACSPAGGPSGAPSASAGPGTIAAQVASYQLVRDRPGRLIVALISAENLWVSFGTARMHFAYLGDRSESPPPGVGLPDATARFLPIPGTPDGAGRQPTLTLPSDGRGLYGVEPITFPRAGFWQVTTSGTFADGTRFSADAAFEVLDKATIRGVGDRAIASNNAVMGDPTVDPAAIDSRAQGGQPIPDPELHRVSIADALAAHVPALIVFSTPVFCVSRFCGPVTDMIDDLAKQYAARADFIHVEIYRDYQANKVNPAVADWLLTPSGDLREPWVFLVDASGTIVGSWDTMVTRGEIEPMLKALPPR